MLEPVQNGGLQAVAQLYEPNSGRVLSVSTDELGVQFYSGQYLAEPFAPHAGLCLETQHYPNSPLRPDFPSVLLKAGQHYRSRTSYVFSVLPESGVLAK